MIAYHQSTRPLQIHTPLGPDAFTVTSYEGEEYVSGLFHYRVGLRSANASLDLQALAGQCAALAIALPGGDSRLVHGVIARAAQTATDVGAASYELELRPWLWLLTMNSDCRIFQNRSTPDIAHEIFSGSGFTAVTNKLESSYTARPYCVQFSETAFDFVSRLFEEEGIFYFFEHSQHAHRLILADASAAWMRATGAAVAHVTGNARGWTEDAAITSCTLEQSVAPGEVAATDFNFETPSTSLTAKTSGHSSSRSMFAYPGRYGRQRDGEKRTGIHLESLEAGARLLRGEGVCRGLAAGAKFTLAGHARKDANVEYAVVKLRVRGTATEHHTSFEAVPVSVRYRPSIITRRPTIPGAQTATVTGKAGEEIWTDQYGRIKVKFHWDRSSAKDENSSCWVRVAQGWAGKQWGGFFLPRIGQEVVVSFLDGDPDRPLVTGCVYNAEQVVPNTLPSAQTKSTVRSHSSPGGGGWNELTFEDKAGAEEVYFRAQKDLRTEVLHDETVTIGHQRSVTVQEADDLLTVTKGNRTITVGQGNESHKVKGTRNVEVGGAETHKNEADYTNQVSGAYTLKVNGSLVIEAGGSVTIKAGTGLQIEAGTSAEVTAGTSLTNKAGTVLTSKGGAEHVVDGGGMVVIKGGVVKIN